jgi:hypothetical protein
MNPGMCMTDDSPSSHLGQVSLNTPGISLIKIYRSPSFRENSISSFVASFSDGAGVSWSF